MSKRMLVVSTKLVNIVFLELHLDEDQPSHTISSEHHYRGDGLMLFNCNGLIPMTYSFNGRWLAVTTFGQEIHADLVGRELRKVIDGENVTITNLEAKFVPKG
ncbi:hypothetical protein CK203_029984 [Vitis vinifera]|uniref:Uncharacterized protein n=1 Tax=Vitis vinifera TaxID=29760 RepID=A0A438IK75_VITVI|nr:hypothetical protein CK203_029984 [Vitis vinifera]